MRIPGAPAQAEADESRGAGVSILDEKSKAKFASKHGITFPLLADADHAVAEKYGVWQEKSRYGRKYMGIARTTYLIGPDGKVAQRWDNVKVNGHVEAVADALAEQRQATQARPKDGHYVARRRESAFASRCLALSTSRWKTNRRSALPSGSVKLYCLPLRILIFRFLS